MATFCWISTAGELPQRWDLRSCGWDVCFATSEEASAGRLQCGDVLLVEASALTPFRRMHLADADRSLGRLVMLGVDDPAERAHLLTLGCGEVLPVSTSLRELEARAERVMEIAQRIPRRRRIGPLTLDLLHRDGRIDRNWLRLHPREFSLMWRLADRPGEQVTRSQLLRDVWRLSCEPETNSVEVHVSRLRGKLARHGCAALVETVPTGGYRIAKGLAEPGAGADKDEQTCGCSTEPEWANALSHD